MAYGIGILTSVGFVDNAVFSPIVIEEVWEVTIAAGNERQYFTAPSPRTSNQPYVIGLGSLGSIAQFGLLNGNGNCLIFRGMSQVNIGGAETFRIMWLKQ